MCLLVLYYYKRVEHKKVCIIKIKRPFMKVILLNKIVKHSLFKPKLEHLVIQFRFHNIHISDQAQLDMINIRLK